MTTPTNTGLLHYLKTYFGTGVVPEMKTHFSEKFGVDIKTEAQADGSTLVLLKYNMLDAKWSFPITHECRGHIYRFTITNEWKRVSRPFDKFFNSDEGYCPIVDSGDFNARVNDLFFVEKVDGSMIQAFFDEATGHWRATTQGMISPGNVGDYSFTFSDLFWKTLGISEEKFALSAEPEYTYIFELACAENRIVTKYPQNQVILLAQRHLENGDYVCDNELENFTLDLLADQANIRLPWKKPFYEFEITDKDSCKLWIETEGVKLVEGTGTEYSEGFVIYSGSYPVAKMKNMRYVSLHAVGGGDLKHTKNVVIDTFFAEKLDDIMGVLHDTMKEFAEQLKVKVSDLFAKIHVASQHIVGKTFADQKDYALTVQKYVPREFWGFFFTNKEKLLDPTTDLEKMFKDWLRINYGRFEDYWKRA